MKSRFDAAGRMLSALAPAALAAAGAASTAPASHDEGVIRTVGAGFAGPFRALDLLVDAPALLLPFGTRALRAGLASALVTGIVGALAYDVARELAEVVPAALSCLGLRGKTESSPRLLAAVATVAVLSALLGPAWQREASAPGGAVTGVLLVLVALRLARAPAQAVDAAVRLPALAFVLGLAASYEPLVFVAALAAIIPSAVPPQVRAGAGAALRAGWLRTTCAFGLGLAPFALALAAFRRSPEIALPIAGVASASATASAFGGELAASFARDVGLVLLLASAGGAALAFLVGSARTLVASLAGIAGVFVLAIVLHAPVGPERYAAAALAGVLGLDLLAVTVLAALVVLIARARVPFAEASAAFVVVIELVLPVRALDETANRRDARVTHAAEIWNDIAWGTAPPASVLLVADRGTMRRIASARAEGAMRGDLVVVPAFDVQGRAGQRALVAEPKLAPLYRDVALGVPPEELSLAELGAQRAVLATFDPTWDRALSRHLVPIGLTSRFEPEPRGASDRRKALETFAPARERLVRVTVAKKDPELAQATAALLRARAVGMAATGEREILEKALDDLRVFSPNDPVDAKLVRRLLTTKGPIDVRDL